MRRLFTGFVFLLVASCSYQEVTDKGPLAEQTSPLTSSADTADALAGSGDWVNHGRTHDEQRYSPLGQITPDTISRLGLLWHYDTGQYRGHEATPLAEDGVLFLTSSWSNVHALDARTGREIWTYDPQVPRTTGRIACCDVVNRGVALSADGVFVGTLDGRLVKLNKATGEVIWDIDTIQSEVHYTITGAPRIVKGNVIIGNGGAEFGVRGYVSAYDVVSGELVWRFWTVPGDPSEAVENHALEKALPTWSGRWWEVGGGGTVWDSMAFDPTLNLLYVGTGNGSPWSRTLRSPGGGDNLYLSSILALNPDTGELVWHYQTTPGDNWDYTATQHMILADLVWNGAPRKLLLQAPKNGFFYVLDRESGELLSAEKYAQVTWASDVDLETGRPKETKLGQYDEEAKIILPSISGGHNWHPMSFHKGTGLVFIPKHDIPGLYAKEDSLEPKIGTFNTGVFPRSSDLHLFSTMSMPKSSLLAWDPITQRVRWEVEHKFGPNGGVLSTRGGLVFQGNALGHFVAYNVTDGKQVWLADLGIGLIAPPITYELDGEQYVTIVAGTGGAPLLQAPNLRKKQNVGRVFTFKLGARQAIPEVPPKTRVQHSPPVLDSTPESIAAGGNLYHRHCSRCHGSRAVSGGVIVDLRHASPVVHENWDKIVLDGLFESMGMAGFGDLLTIDESKAIRSYVVSQAHLQTE